MRLNSGAKLAEEVGATNVHRKLPIRVVNLFTDEGSPYGRNIQAGWVIGLVEHAMWADSLYFLCRTMEKV
jgi:hypothetical protein